MTAKERLQDALDAVSRIDDMLTEFESTGDRGLLVSVASMMRELHPSLRELSVWSECKTAECAPLLVTLSQRMKAAVARTRLLSKGSDSAAAQQQPEEEEQQQEPEPLKGWLKKQGERGLVKSFKERYFVQRDSHLLYFVSEEDINKEPQGWIDLSRIISVHKNSLPGGFDVATSGRTFHLQVIADDNGSPGGSSSKRASRASMRELLEDDEQLSAKLGYWVDGLLRWKEWQQRQIEEMNRAPLSPPTSSLMRQLPAASQAQAVAVAAGSPGLQKEVLGASPSSLSTEDSEEVDPLVNSYVPSPAKVPLPKAKRTLFDPHALPKGNGDEEDEDENEHAPANEELQRENQRLLEQLEERDEELQRARDELKTAQRSSQMQLQDLRSREQEVQALKAELSAREKTAEQLRDELARLEELGRTRSAQNNVLQAEIESLRSENVAKDALLLQLGQQQRQRGRTWDAEDDERASQRADEEREAQAERVVWLSSELTKVEKQLKITKKSKDETIDALKDALAVTNEKLRSMRLNSYDEKPADALVEELEVLKREYFAIAGVACKLSLQQSGISVNSALDMDTLYDAVSESLPRNMWGRAISAHLEGKAISEIIEK